MSEQQTLDLQLDESIIKENATADAMLDGTGDRFQRFRLRLPMLARSVAEDNTASTVRSFREWADEFSQKFVKTAGDIPENSDIFVKQLEVQTAGNLAGATAQYSGKIIQLGKDKKLWERRFGPSLHTNLDKPPQKNAFLLAGLVLFLVAVESIANSQFFAEGNQFGFVGGALKAIAISFGNILIPLGLAFFGHRWFYAHDSFRILGPVMIGVFLLWAFGFNYFVAQHRESLLITAGKNFNIMDSVLLFALGAAAAGFSFWKMWSFLDPFKQARKCMDDLRVTTEKFEEGVCSDLNNAQNRCNDVSAQIRQWEAEIPNKFRFEEANFSRANGETIGKTNRVFAIYYQQYCVMKVDPDPDEPIVTPENAAEYSAGITDADWRFFAEMKTLLHDQINTATQEWIPKLQDVLQEIIELIKRFNAVIVAKLLEWKAQAQPA